MDLTREKISRIFGLLLLVNTVLCLLLLGGAYPIAAYYQDPRVVDLIRVMSLGFLLVPFNAIPSAIASRNMEYRLLSTVSLVTNIIGAASTLLLALAGHGVWALVTGPLVATLLNALALNLYERQLVWRHGGRVRRRRGPGPLDRCS